MCCLKLFTVALFDNNVKQMKATGNFLATFERLRGKNVLHVAQ